MANAKSIVSRTISVELVQRRASDVRDLIYSASALVGAAVAVPLAYESLGQDELSDDLARNDVARTLRVARELLAEAALGLDEVRVTAPEGRKAVRP